jgi:hypothetical protein
MGCERTKLGPPQRFLEYKKTIGNLNPLEIEEYFVRLDLGICAEKNILIKPTFMSEKKS